MTYLCLVFFVYYFQNTFLARGIVHLFEGRKVFFQIIGKSIMIRNHSRVASTAVEDELISVLAGKDKRLNLVVD
jgi:hypothetical protein